MVIIPGTADFDHDDDVDQEDILSSTQGLISIDSDSKTIRPVHLTQGDYYSNEHVRNKWFPSAHKISLKHVCRYLNYDTRYDK